VNMSGAVKEADLVQCTPHTHAATQLPPSSNTCLVQCIPHTHAAQSTSKTCRSCAHCPTLPKAARRTVHSNFQHEGQPYDSFTLPRTRAFLCSPLWYSSYLNLLTCYSSFQVGKYVNNESTFSHETTSIFNNATLDVFRLCIT